MLTRDNAPLVEQFRRYLRDRRLPVTRQRVAVAEVLLASDDHPSVETLRHRLEAKGLHVGTATLYRTVDALVKSGLVLEHDFGDGFRRYEPATPTIEHAHLVCRRCGGVVEFANDRLERMLRMTADEQHFHYERHKVEIHGICAACRTRDLGAAPRPDR